MSRQRPARRLSGGAVACPGLLLGAVLLTGCGTGPVEVEAPTLAGADARACSALIDAVPGRVGGHDRREVEGPGYAAAWGDPAIELRCGVGRPAGFDKFATCQTVNGVDWYIPQSQMTGEPADILMTTVGRAQNVEVRVPEDYWPPAATMVDLAGAIRHTIPPRDSCV
jgi:hypothetical protein